MAERKKIVKYRRPINLNIGVIVFGIIFIYIAYNTFSYFTTEHISVYEVGHGTIAENNTYYGLILREEKIFNSEYDGYINYYMRDSAKAGYQSLVCSVDENGDVASKMGAAENAEAELDSEDYGSLKQTISSFDKSFDAGSFFQVYTFKDELDAQLMEAVNQNALSSLGDYVSMAQTNQSFHLMNAPEPGIVVYYTDGFENVTVDSFSPDMLNQLNYSKTSLKRVQNVQAGSPAYKLITSEEWKIILPINEDTQKRLAGESVVKIQFKKDAISCWVNFEIKKEKDAYYIVLSLKDHMVRFANDRYAEIELLTEEETGLKIPNTAITKKEFFTVPKEYFMKGGNSNAFGLLVEQPDESKKSTVTFVETTLYNEKDDRYFIDEETIKRGAVIQKPDSNETYKIKETETLEGVYNINKGYAVFKQIEILYQNEEYSVVRTGTSYGLSLYDHIALEGDKVKENDLIH